MIEAATVQCAAFSRTPGSRSGRGARPIRLRMRLVTFSASLRYLSRRPLRVVGSGSGSGMMLIGSIANGRSSTAWTSAVRSVLVSVWLISNLHCLGGFHDHLGGDEEVDFIVAIGDALDTNCWDVEALHDGQADVLGHPDILAAL